MLYIYSKIQKVDQDVTSNQQILDNHKNDISENQNLNKDYIQYLNTRISETKKAGIDNYEELYKSVILQNDILKTTTDEMKSNIIFSDRNSELVSKKKILHVFNLQIFIYYLFHSVNYLFHSLIPFIYINIRLLIRLGGFIIIIIKTNILWN
jgi:hypothetical protein